MNPYYTAVVAAAGFHLKQPGGRFPSFFPPPFATHHSSALMRPTCSPKSGSGGSPLPPLFPSLASNGGSSAFTAVSAGSRPTFSREINRTFAVEPKPEETRNGEPKMNSLRRESFEDKECRRGKLDHEHSMEVSAESGILDCSTEDKEGKISHFSPPGILSISSLGHPENIYESAAKLLFMSVKWARSIPSFHQLVARDQNLLLEETWSQLFIIGLAQWSISFDEATLVKDSVCLDDEKSHLLAKAQRLKDLVTKINTLRLDHTEYTCLKAIILFKPEIIGIRQPSQVELLQDQTHLMLQEYCQSKPNLPNGKVRFGRLLLVLPALQAISARTVEMLFFKKTVGNIAMER
eukprot:maker-scaffold288_size220435-snap-gene-0.8 protein:Tk01458 transcript:maker-scaffold288_size220435-snap-gene-0.8-mRNA-1 annotation:"hypothetical protein D910_01375"